MPLPVADLLRHRLAHVVGEPASPGVRLLRRLRDDGHGHLRTRHCDVVDAERLLLGAVPAPLLRLGEARQRRQREPAGIRQNPSIGDKRPVRGRVDRVVLVERQHHVVEAKALGAVDGHYPHLPRLGDVALLLGRQELREVREPHSRLHPELELGRGAEKIRKARLCELAPRLLRVLGPQGAQLAEDADKSARRERLRGEHRELARLRNARREPGARKRRRGEVRVRLAVARMVRKRHEVEEAA